LFFGIIFKDKIMYLPIMVGIGVPKSVDKPLGPESLREQALKVAAAVAAVEESVSSLDPKGDPQTLATTGSFLATLVLRECPGNVGSYVHDETKYPTVVSRRGTGIEKWTKEMALLWAERTYTSNANGGSIPLSFKQLIKKGKGE
jgi:hypothetical protein